MFWDVPAYAEHTAVKAKRVDAFVEHKTNKVKAVEMFFSWVEPSEKKSQETAKYGPLWFELKKQHPSYDVELCNIMISLTSKGGGQGL